MSKQYELLTFWSNLSFFDVGGSRSFHQNTATSTNSTGRKEGSFIIQDEFSLSKNYMRTALFWAVTQRLVITAYRRFGTTYRPSSKVKNSNFLDLADGTRKLSRNVGKELPPHAA